LVGDDDEDTPSPQREISKTPRSSEIRIIEVDKGDF